MQKKYCLDTNVWMDYYEDRKDKHKNLGEIAFRLLCKLLATGSKIIVSLLLLKELETFYTLEEIRGIINPFEKLLSQCPSQKSKRKRQKRLQKRGKSQEGMCSMQSLQETIMPYLFQEISISKS